MIECGNRIETDSTKVRKIVYYDNDGNDTLTFRLNPQEKLEEVIRRDTAFNILQTISYRILENSLDALKYSIMEKMMKCSVYDDDRKQKTNALLTDTFALKNITNAIWEREPRNGKEFVEGLKKAVNPNNIIVLRSFDFPSHKKYLNNRYANLYPCLIVTNITNNPDKTINIEWWCSKGKTETLYNVKEKYLMEIFCYYGVFAIN